MTAPPTAACRTDLAPGLRGGPGHAPGVLVLSLVLVFAAASVARPTARAQGQVEIPPQNRPDRKEPPPRPPLGDAEDRARLLFEAILHDDPARAEPFFFPREAFLVIKAMARPERYYDRLHARFARDIHALHAAIPERDRANARFERLELVRRGGFVRVGEEGNRLPYWASRHSFVHYRVGEARRKLEVRVLITWGERWYVIHLSEFK